MDLNLLWIIPCDSLAAVYRQSRTKELNATSGDWKTVCITYTLSFKHTHTHIYIYIYIYICWTTQPHSFFNTPYLYCYQHGRGQNMLALCKCLFVTMERPTQVKHLLITQLKGKMLDDLRTGCSPNKLITCIIGTNTQIHVAENTQIHVKRRHQWAVSRGSVNRFKSCLTGSAHSPATVHGAVIINLLFQKALFCFPVAMLTENYGCNLVMPFKDNYFSMEAAL